jgi:AcrR family transcriptional regulator
VAEEYVMTEDFEELLENTLRRAAQARSAEKRRLYRSILTTAIKHPGSDYDEQLRFLKTLDELDPDHIKILRALLQGPESDLGMMGSPIQTLRQRIPEMTEAQIEQLVNGLNDRRLTSMTSLRTMMTAHGAADLQHAVTPYGRRLLRYVEGA